VRLPLRLQALFFGKVQSSGKVNKNPLSHKAEGIFIERV
jgi:hypothetical protein